MDSMKSTPAFVELPVPENKITSECANSSATVATIRGTNRLSLELHETASAIIYSIVETANANNLKPYDYFEYLLSEMPKHMDDTDNSFLEDLFPWSPNLPERIRKPK